MDGGVLRGLAWGLVLFGWMGDLAAQEPTGWTATLDDVDRARRGEVMRLRGQAFEVRGLATLRPGGGVTVRGRYVSAAEDVPEGPWAEAQASRTGAFTLPIAVPQNARGASRVEVRLGDGPMARTLEHHIRVVEPFALELRTDRRFYESDEPIRIWALVRDLATGAPVRAGVRFEVFGREVEVRSSAAGVAFHELAPPLLDGTHRVRAHVGDLVRTVSIDVGERSRERLLIDLDWPESSVTPGDAFHPAIEVRSMTGTPVRDAAVTLTVAGMDPLTARTDADGRARIEARAPTYLRDDTGHVSVQASVRHPAHGVVSTRRTLVLAVPLALRIEVVPDHGGIVPGLPSSLYVRGADVAGEPPEPGTEVVVRGPGLPRGGATVRTDANGLAQVTVRAGRDEMARHLGGACSSADAAAVYEVEVEGPRTRIARQCVKARPEATVLPRLASPVIARGETAVVEVERRPEVRGRPVMVLAYHEGQLVGAVELAANERRAELALEVVGHLRLRAFPVLDPSDAETTFGVGAPAALLIHPPAPTFPGAAPTADVFDVGGEARVEVRGARAGWLAVDVRDLAQHGGERPFAMHFLDRRFSEAMLDESTEGRELLLRATVAARLNAETIPSPAPPLLDRLGRPNGGGGDPRDAVVRARELARRGAGDAMQRLERAVRDADAGDLSRLTDGEGARRRFREDALEQLDVELLTAGGRPATPGMLRAADPSFGFEAVARRVARERLVAALVELAQYLDPDAHRDHVPASRWIAELRREGRIDERGARDPWGGALGLREAPADALLVSPRSTQTLAFPGPDGRLGTRDDVVDPFARVVAAGTPYAIASGEDRLLARLSRLAPGAAALEAMLRAFDRETGDMMAALRGDAAYAAATEGLAGTGEGTIGLGNLGTIGHGGGGGTGSGYGRGAGRSARAPRIRAGSASVRGGPPGSLSGVVREDFPATLTLLPELPVDASGTTTVAIPLADAATTYLVEVVHWRADGWSWSANTRFRVRQELVVSAPVPRHATEGDTLVLPVRAANHGGTDREVVVRVVGEDVALEPVESRLRVPAGEAAVAPLRVTLPEVGEGHLRIEASAGDLRDAMRLPIAVQPHARGARLRAEGLVGEAETLRFEVPDDARPRGELRVEVVTARAAFRSSSRTLMDDWSTALEGEVPPQSAAHDYLDDEERPRASLELAFAVGVAWRGDGVSDDAVLAALEVLTERTLGESVVTERELALTLLALAPAARETSARPPLAAALGGLVKRLQREVTRMAASSSEAPALQAAAAAALAWTGATERAGEHVRRARRGLIRFEDELWVQSPGPSFGRLLPSALLSLADVKLGEREEAFGLARMMISRQVRGNSVSGLERGLALAAARALVSEDPGESLAIQVDGQARDVPLSRGRGFVEGEWNLPGTHRVGAPGAPLVYVQVSGEVAVPGGETPAARVPMRLTLEAEEDTEVPRVDRYTAYALVVRNARPRTQRAPIVELTLPAGAELDASARRALEARLRAPPHLENGRLRMQLRPLAPGREVTLPLRLRWSVAGELRGLGAAVFPLERPDAAFVRMPETIVTEDDR